MDQTSGTKIDLTRFHETFFQESLEGLSVMESGLLALARAVDGSADPEILNNVFRAAHSIKGGSATFGFEDIAEFTHLLETILSLMREGGAMPHGSTTEVLLQSIDWLRELLNARLEGREPDRALMHRATADLATVLASSKIDDDTSSRHAEVPQTADTNRHPDLKISFCPHQHLFRSGNDPLLYLLELGKLGYVTSEIDLARMPELATLDTETSYLAWDVTLSEPSGTIPKVREVFEWIEGDCDLEISEVVDEKLQKAEIERGGKSEAANSGAKEGASIRVATKKVDALVNLVGELVITQSIISCIGDDFEVSQLEKLRRGIVQLTRNTRELQETVLQLRMLPVSNLFERFPRLVHDLSRRLGKTAKLTITGGQTELDKTVLERLSDPLVHLIRNSMDHGIERPEARREVNKPDEGTLHLHAEHRGGNIVIEISDDGAGLDERRILARAKERGLVSNTATLTSAEIHALIFEPGFSTAEEVTDLSGRGVGMDVVKRNVEQLGGSIRLTSRAGFGTTTTVQLPLTLAIMEGQLLRVGSQRFVVPLISIVESLRVEKGALHTIAGGVELYPLRNEYLRVVHLENVFNLDCDPAATETGLLVVVEARGKRVALRVDDLLAQQQVVIKSLETNLHKVDGITGATILGDGSIAVILDVERIIERS